MTAIHDIRILLADDHEIFLDGLRGMLQKQAGMNVVGVAANGKEAFELTAQYDPDIVLMDIQMPVMDGIEATKHISENYPRTSIIALSMFNQENLVVDILEAGAKGYLLKNAHKTEITEAILSVYLNKPYYCSNTTTTLARMIGHSRYNPFHEDNQALFSERERKIIRLICGEKTTKEIAEILCMSDRTIEGCRIRIHEKMQVKSVAGIVIYAIKHKMHNI